MVAARGAIQPWDCEVDASNDTYPLPEIELGVGIYWFRASAVDWEARSFKSAVVKDPSGSFLLVEEPNSYGSIGSGCRYPRPSCAGRHCRLEWR